MPSETDWNRYWLIAIALPTIAAVLYGILVVQQALLGVGVVVPLAVLYLLWRFVRAHERIADALETRETDRERVTDRE